MRKIKRIISAILFVALIIGNCQSAQAANDGVNATRFLKYYGEGKYKKANKYAKRLRKTAKEPCVKKMPSKMKKAYLRAAKNHYAQVSGKTIYMWDYYLSDIDNDEKAELFIKYGTCEAGMQLLVYQYIEGEAVMVDSVYCSHSTLCAYKNNEGIIMYESHMGGEAIYLLTLENGKIKSKIIGSRYVDTGDYITLKGVLKSHVFYNKNWKKTVRYYDLISI